MVMPLSRRSGRRVDLIRQQFFAGPVIISFIGCSTCRHKEKVRTNEVFIGGRIEIDWFQSGCSGLQGIIAGMRIYFSGAISGGREYLAVYQRIVALLQDRGHTVPTLHVADSNVLESESRVSARDVYERDVAWIRESDAVIAEVSTPSLGVGYEVRYALERHIPVLCLYREGLAISKMITGNSSPHITIAAYRQLEEIDQHIHVFLTEKAVPPKSRI